MGKVKPGPVPRLHGMGTRPAVSILPHNPSNKAQAWDTKPNSVNSFVLQQANG